jgi:long-subunit fatty acid transport protein
VNTPHDIPALFTVGASYQITPAFLASIGYHHFFESDAKMSGDKQKYINGGVNEYIAGAEYRINKMFLLSAGIQYTKSGVTDDYQADLSFSLDSYTIGFGGMVNVSKNVAINIGYFWTTYMDWTIEKSKYASVPGSNPAVYLPGKDVFSRTNKVFAAGVDFSF